MTSSEKYQIKNMLHKQAACLGLITTCDDFKYADPVCRFTLYSVREIAKAIESLDEDTLDSILHAWDDENTSCPFNLSNYTHEKDKNAIKDCLRPIYDNLHRLFGKRIWCPRRGIVESCRIHAEGEFYCHEECGLDDICRDTRDPWGGDREK